MDDNLGKPFQRLHVAGVESTLNNRLAWQALPTTASAWGESPRGALLLGEPVWQSSIAGKPSASSSAPITLFQASQSIWDP
jgi:hypothetical protein